MFQAIRIFTRQIKKVLSYLPILWQDNDEEFDCALILLRHKLKQMESHFDACYGLEEEKQQIEHTIEHITYVLNPDEYNKGLYSFEKRIGMSHEEYTDSMQNEKDEYRTHWESIWDNIKFGGNGWNE